MKVREFVESYLESGKSVYIDKSDSFFTKRFGNEHSDAYVKEYIERAISYNYGISEDSAKLKLSNEEFSDDEIKKSILYYDGSDLEGKEHYDNFKWLLDKYGLSENKLLESSYVNGMKEVGKQLYKLNPEYKLIKSKEYEDNITYMVPYLDGMNAEDKYNMDVNFSRIMHAAVDKHNFGWRYYGTNDDGIWFAVFKD